MPETDPLEQLKRLRNVVIGGNAAWINNGSVFDIAISAWEKERAAVLQVAEEIEQCANDLDGDVDIGSVVGDSWAARLRKACE